MTEAHVSQKKKDEMVLLQKFIKQYKVVGIIDLSNLPSSQFQSIKHSLKKKNKIRVTKKRLLLRLFNENKDEMKGIEGLDSYLQKSLPAVLFSNENPFKIYGELKKATSDAPAKAGQTAPEDLSAKAGPTPFMPGPMIGELGQLGIKTKVEEGKISILEDAVLVKEGEVINNNIADLLTKLGLKPMKIGMNMVACYDDGVVFDKKTLDIDLDEVTQNFKVGATQALNLATNSGYVMKENIGMLLNKAYRQAVAVAEKAGVMTPDSVKKGIVDLARQGNAIKGKLPEAPEEETKTDDKPVEETKEEPKQEESVKEETKEKEEPKVEKESVEEETKVEEKAKKEPKVEEKQEETKAEEETKEEPLKKETKEEEVKEKPKVEETAKEEKKVEEEEKEEEPPKDADIEEKAPTDENQKVEKESNMEEEQKNLDEQKVAKELLTKITDEQIKEDDKKKSGKTVSSAVPSAHDLAKTKSDEQ
ncbi:50S ribosomal protein L10 [archaeon]|nr:50S ribosomal protein L10 [archaeon]|tara:strand:- start:1376 stop:2803 length:1428 start_codon:yes stop_codon:yes gene_type:complete